MKNNCRIKTVSYCDHSCSKSHLWLRLSNSPSRVSNWPVIEQSCGSKDCRKSRLKSGWGNSNALQTHWGARGVGAFAHKNVPTLSMTGRRRMLRRPATIFALFFSAITPFTMVTISVFSFFTVFADYIPLSLCLGNLMPFGSVILWRIGKVKNRCRERRNQFFCSFHKTWRSSRYRVAKATWFCGVRLLASWRSPPCFVAFAKMPTIAHWWWWKSLWHLEE